jgi:TonB family protein
MSKDHDDHGTHGAHTVRASKGGSGGKWLLGALAAVVLVGGGYAAYQTFGNGQNNDTQTAYNDSYADDPYASDPLRAGPIEQSDDITAETASTDAAAPAAAPAQRSSARSATRSSSTTVAQGDVPEETIGIMPVNAVQDSDEIIVNAPRRPVWTRTPNPRRLSAFYPESDLNRGREGEASLRCTVVDNGALDCLRASETSSGFGRAALRVARTYRHAPTLADGSDATGTPVNLRVLFRLADEDQRGRG